MTRWIEYRRYAKPSPLRTNHPHVSSWRHRSLHSLDGNASSQTTDINIQRFAEAIAPQTNTPNPISIHSKLLRELLHCPPQLCLRSSSMPKHSHHRFRYHRSHCSLLSLENTQPTECNCLRSFSESGWMVELEVCGCGGWEGAFWAGTEEFEAGYA